MKVAVRALAALGVIALAAGLSACSPQKPAVVPSDDAATPAVVVTVVDNTYEPKEVTVKPGEAVRWEWAKNSAKHDVVSKEGSFVSELIMEGSYTHVFETQGEFDYFCSVHPEMTGLVTVK